MILQSLGTIMITTGIMTANWPLVLAGLGVTLIGGVVSGVKSRNQQAQPSASYAAQTVRFELEGDKLVGLMDRHNGNMRYLT